MKSAERLMGVLERLNVIRERNLVTYEADRPWGLGVAVLEIAELPARVRAQLEAPDAIKVLVRP